MREYTADWKNSNYLTERGTQMSTLQLVTEYTPPTWQIPIKLTPLSGRGSDRGLWIDPAALLRELNGWALAQWAILLAQRLKFWALPKSRGPGYPQVCRDEVVNLLHRSLAIIYEISPRMNCLSSESGRWP